MDEGPLAGRSHHYSAVIGSQLYVWGGKAANNNLLLDGAFFTDTVSAGFWTSMNTILAPARQLNATFFATDREIFLFGGETGGIGVNSGGVYSP